jgi:peroxiredoxin
MRRSSSWMVGAAVLLTTVWLGCSPATDKKQPNDPAKSPSGEATPTAFEPALVAEKLATEKIPDETPVVEKTLAPEPPPKPTVPEVHLPEAMAATCVVQVGDVLPDATLPDVDGKATELRSRFGAKLTVVCFWRSDNVYAIEELRDLQTLVAAPGANKGVRVVAINEGETPKPVADAFQATSVTFPCLLDPDGTYFRKVATEKLPRTYLVNAQGKILWFDIEYSLSTQRDLLQAIRAVLGEK